MNGKSFQNTFKMHPNPFKNQAKMVEIQAKPMEAHFKMHRIRNWGTLTKSLNEPTVPKVGGRPPSGPAVRPRSKRPFGSLWASPYSRSYTLERIQNITWPAAWGQDPPYDASKRRGHRLRKVWRFESLKVWIFQSGSRRTTEIENSNFQTFKLSNFQTFKLSNLPAPLGHPNRKCKFSNFQTFKLSNFP